MVVAIEEVRLVMSGVSKGLPARLAEVFPHRSKDSMAKLRRHPEYIGLRTAEFEKHELRRLGSNGTSEVRTGNETDKEGEVEASKVPKGVSDGNETNEFNVSERNAGTGPVDPKLTGNCEYDWKARLRLSLGERLTQAHLCDTPSKINREFRRWAGQVRTTKKFQKELPKRPPVVGNRAARRRILRAAWLSAYEKRPAVTSRRICEGKSLDDRETYPDGMKEFWGDMFGKVGEPAGEVETEGWETGHTSLLRPITGDEVKDHLRRMRAGAAGVDGVTLRHLRSLKPAELAEWFNSFLLVACIPRALKRFRTIFLPKVETPSGPKDYRPITIGSYFRRLFAGILAARLREVPTHFTQRGFKREEGCAINQELLRAVVTGHIRDRRALSYVFLDVSKAFDSVCHEKLYVAYQKAGIPEGLGSLFSDMYKGNTTMFGTDEEVIRIKRGVLQGDPLSPIIFNLVMDVAVRSLDQRIGGKLQDTIVPQLLFADDAVLFGQTLQGTQSNVRKFESALGYFGLAMNPAKCAAVHLRADGKSKRWYVDDRACLMVGGKAVRNLGVGEAYKYLGLRMSLGDCTTDVRLELRKMLGNITKSVVKPQHKLEILRTVAIPKIEYVLVNGRYPRGVLRDCDRYCRMAVAGWCHLPKDTPIAMYHTAISDGGLGVPSMSTKVPRLQATRRTKIMEMEEPDAHIEALRRTPYWLSTAGPRAPEALGTNVRAEAEQPESVTRPADAVAGEESSGRDEVLVDRETERKYWHEKLCASVDGAGLKDHPGGFAGRFFSDRFVRLTGKEFVRALHLRCGVLRTPARSNRGRVFGSGPKCPSCPDRVATLGHLIQNCGRTHRPRVHRHDAITKMLVNKLRKLGFEVRTEPHIRDGNSFLKPDIVAFRKRDQVLMLLDPTIVHCKGDLENAARAKEQKYSTADMFRWTEQEYGTAGKRENMTIQGIVMNFRGAWARSSSGLLRALGCRPSFLELLSYKVLRLGSFIYNSLRERSDWNFSTARDRTRPKNNT
jgi:hypothetical protein